MKIEKVNLNRENLSSVFLLPCPEGFTPSSVSKRCNLSFLLAGRFFLERS